MQNFVARLRKPIAARASLLALTAIFLCAPMHSVLAKGGWFSECIKASSSDMDSAQCRVEYINRLKREQAGLLRRIGATLSQPSPSEMDFPKARALLNQSQKQWVSFVATDCDIISFVFGAGNAIGAAGQTCVIDHYKTRNAQLKQLFAHYLSPERLSGE